MLLLISDASVLIAMHNGGLLEDLFLLDFRFAVPDVVFEIELQPYYPNLLEHGLEIHILSGESMERAELYVQQYPRLSTPDRFALVLAQVEAGILLTGDSALRQAAIRENVEAHGVIWLIEQMMIANLLDKFQAEEAFRRMRHEGDHLPWQEVQEMLNRY